MNLEGIGRGRAQAGQWMGPAGKPQQARRRRRPDAFVVRGMALLALLAAAICVIESGRGHVMAGRGGDPRFEGWAVVVSELLGGGGHRGPSDEPAAAAPKYRVQSSHGFSLRWGGGRGKHKRRGDEEGAAVGASPEVVELLASVVSEVEAGRDLSPLLHDCDPYGGGCECLARWLGQAAEERCQGLREREQQGTTDSGDDGGRPVVRLSLGSGRRRRREGGSGGAAMVGLRPDVYDCHGGLVCVLEERVHRGTDALLQDCEGQPRPMTRAYVHQAIITTNLHGKGPSSGYCDPAKRREAGTTHDQSQLWVGPRPHNASAPPEEEEAAAVPVLPAWPVDVPLRLMRLAPAPLHDKRWAVLLPGWNDDGTTAEEASSPPRAHYYVKALAGVLSEGVPLALGRDGSRLVTQVGDMQGKVVGRAMGHDGGNCTAFLGGQAALLSSGEEAVSRGLGLCAVRHHAFTLIRGISHKSAPDWSGRLEDWSELWRALLLGSVPVVLGALPPQVEALLPHRDAVIRWSDFDGKGRGLGRYLKALMEEEERGHTYTSKHLGWKQHHHQHHAGGSSLFEAAFGAGGPREEAVCQLCHRVLQWRGGEVDEAWQERPPGPPLHHKEEEEVPGPGCWSGVVSEHGLMALLPPAAAPLRRSGGKPAAAGEGGAPTTLADVGVGAAYVMHYRGLRDRVGHIKRVARAMPGVEVRVVTGFDRGTAGYEAGERCLLAPPPKGGPVLSAGQISLALKHWSALHHLLAHTDHPSALLLEDDAAFAQDARAFSASLAERLAEASGYGYDVVFVGGCHSDWPVRGRMASAHLQLVSESHCTSGYVVSRQGAAKLLSSSALPFHLPVDWALNEAWRALRPNLTFFQLHPLAVKQHARLFAQGNTLIDSDDDQDEGEEQQQVVVEG